MPRYALIACLASGFLGSTSSPESVRPPLATFQVTAMDPAPGSVATGVVTQVLLTFNGTVDPLTALTSAVSVAEAGTDTVFGTGDDVTITPASIGVQSGNQIKIAFTSLLSQGKYRVKLSGSVTEPSGLVGCWKLDEGSGTTAADSSSSGNNGALNGPTWTAGRAGTGLHFAGGTDKVVIGAADIPVPWSASLWVRREDAPTADARMMDSSAFGTGSSLRLEQYDNTNKVGLTQYGVGDPNFGYTAPVGTWTHLAFVCNGGDTKVYVNGDPGYTAVSLVPALSRWHLGSHGGNSMVGDLDEIRVFNQVLSMAEIQLLSILGGAVRDTTGAVLDGEFGGSLPSGDGTDGGDFVATFQVNPTPPNAPSGLSATATSASSIQLNWSDNSTDEIGFRVERSTDGVVFVQAATVGPNVSSLADGELASGTPYTYRVRAYSAAGNSTYSNAASDTTLSVSATIKIAAMSPAPGSTLTAPPTEILISFSANTDAATIGPGTVRLVRPGADSTFGTSDDVIVVPTALTLTTPSQLKIDLTGLALPNDGYRLTIAGTAVPPYGLLHRWRFDEGSGTAATDSISQTSTGTLSGPTWSTGKLGSALHYAGGTDTVLVGASNLAPPWTAAMWVRREDSPAVDARIMDCESFGQGGSLRLEQYSGTNQVGVTRYGSWDSTFGYLAPLATWTHLAFVCDGTKIVLYANGVSGGTIGSVVDLPRWFLGSQGANAMKGDLDDVRVYDRALSATEAGTLATLGGVARDGGGVALDGEYTGSFPSGDGSEGGDFVATFAVNVTAPTAPSNLTATTTSFTQITLQWTDASDNEEGFRIERSTNGVDFTEVATTPANTTTYTVDGLSSLTKYWFRVRAYAFGLNSAYSNTATATTAGIEGGVGGGGGGCGALGIEFLLVPGAVLLWRKRRKHRRARRA